MTTEHRHPEEGDLIRYLDGELEARIHGLVKEHVDGCSRCRSELELLRQVAVAFSNELGLDTIESPPTRFSEIRRRRISIPWRVAAVIVIMLPLSASLRPVRAFVASGWESVAQALGFSRPPVVAGDSVVTDESVAPEGAVITFRPRVTVLTVNVDSWQETGSLRIEFGVADNVSAQILATGGTEDIVVVPNMGIRIGNSSASVASYRVVVPNTLDAVVLVVDGRQVAQLGDVQNQRDTTLSLFRR